MKIKVKLYGELALKHGAEVEIEIEGEATVRDVLKILRISKSEHHLILNERKVSKDHPIRDGDTLKVLPVVYGGLFSQAHVFSKCER
ncbi:MoaD/ThiS family protein [Thermococcus aggregans]|uniref:MoaD/ThiS family protein n=1 Tax=Thermococcus aggregans TaxID=110163 RepID=A0A9E7SNH6_THEAG|nr:MoaD/ThiS family protein [Thermococcus aggregans]USS40254.1 MoaD/ThiS family protein [Thermococcus aggregans]